MSEIWTLNIWTDDSSDFRQFLVPENKTSLVVPNLDAFHCYKALKMLISIPILDTLSSELQTLSEYWTHRNPDADQLSDLQTSPDFRHFKIKMES